MYTRDGYKIEKVYNETNSVKNNLKRKKILEFMMKFIEQSTVFTLHTYLQSIPHHRQYSKDES